MKQKDIIKTDRLLLRPMSDEELQERVYNAGSAEEKKQQLERLTGCQIYPALRLWHTGWIITHRKTGACIGTIGFKGHPNARGEVEIDYEILPAYRMQGYCTEALRAMVKWAFDRDGAYYLFAEAEPGNTATGAMLEKLQFQPTGQWGGGGPRYVLARPKEENMRDMLTLGVTIGLFAGVLMGNLNAGILIGAFAGVIIGGYLDGKDRRILENLGNLQK